MQKLIFVRNMSKCKHQVKATNFRPKVSDTSIKSTKWTTETTWCFGQKTTQDLSYPMQRSCKHKLSYTAKKRLAQQSSMWEKNYALNKCQFQHSSLISDRFILVNSLEIGGKSFGDNTRWALRIRQSFKIRNNKKSAFNTLGWFFVYKRKFFMWVGKWWILQYAFLIKQKKLGIVNDLFTYKHNNSMFWILMFQHFIFVLFFLHQTDLSLRKHPFLLALRRWGRFARRNVCDSATEIPYWWRKSMFT